MLDSEFWPTWEKTKQEKLHRYSRAQLCRFYDYFAERQYELRPAQIKEKVATDERMQSIQRELDRRHKRTTTLIAVFAIVVPAAIAVGQCHANKPSATPENYRANTVPSTTQQSLAVPSPTTPTTKNVPLSPATPELTTPQQTPQSTPTAAKP